MAKATTGIVIYRLGIKAIVATVNINERYYLAATDTFFEGTLEEFQLANPDYKMLQDVIKNDLNDIPLKM